MHPYQQSMLHNVSLFFLQLTKNPPSDKKLSLPVSIQQVLPHEQECAYVQSAMSRVLVELKSCILASQPSGG